MVNKDAAQMQRKWVREEVVVLVSEYFKSKLLSKDEIKCRQEFRLFVKHGGKPIFETWYNSIRFLLYHHI